MKQKHIDAYMDIADRFAQLSTAKRLQVGAIIVKDERIISLGYNGTPAGWDNECEYEVTEFHSEFGIGTKLVKTGELKTKSEVIHAEANCLGKLAKSSESGSGSTMFLTHAPCIDCAKQIFTAGISKLYFKNQYRSTEGLDFLKKCNVEIIHHQNE